MENWNRFLSDMFGDKATMESVRTAIGHTLMGSMQGTVFLLVGSGATGKTTFLSLLGLMSANVAASEDLDKNDAKQWASRTDGMVLWAASNEVPAWLRQALICGETRRIVVYQTKSAESRDPALLSKLVQEMPAIREWATTDLPAWKQPEWRVPDDWTIWKRNRVYSKNGVAGQGRVG